MNQEPEQEILLNGTDTNAGKLADVAEPSPQTVEEILVTSFRKEETEALETLHRIACHRAQSSQEELILDTMRTTASLDTYKRALTRVLMERKPMNRRTRRIYQAAERKKAKPSNRVYRRRMYLEAVSQGITISELIANQAADAADQVTGNNAMEAIVDEVGAAQ